MLYECAFCNKIYDEMEGVMRLEELPSFIGTKPIYVFKCKNCMNKKSREEFERFKTKK